MPRDQSVEKWATPPKEFRPLVRWWWPGMEIELEELRREITELDDLYFGGVEIQPFLFGVPGKIRGHKNLIHRYAPHPFFAESLQIVLSEAKQKGLVVDLTLGSGWPPGGVHVERKDSLQTLLFGVQAIGGGCKIEISPPPPQLPPYFKHQKLMKGLMGPIFDQYHTDEFKPIAIVAVKPRKAPKNPNFMFPKRHHLDIDSVQDITDHLDGNGILRWDAPPGKWQIFAFYAGPSGMTPMNDAKSDPTRVSLVVDMFNETRIDSFLDGLFRQFLEECPSELRGSLRALFTDSQEVASEWFWTDDFGAEFQKRRGYDVRPFLPVCFVPNRDNQFIEVMIQGESPCYEFLDGLGERIRHDWLKTLSEIWAERYCGGISRWGTKYGLQHRIQTYGITLDLLQAYAYADIPETEQLYAGGLLDFLKLAGSAGVLFQKPIVSCESMVWRNRDHMTTPLKWKVATDRLFVAGINQMIYHGYPYTHPEIPYPNYDPWSWCSSNFNRNNPFHPYFQAMNAYVARGQFLLRQGTSVVQIGVYFPYHNYNHKCMKREDLANGFLDGFDAPPPGGLIFWFLSRPRKKIDHLFLNHQKLCDDLVSAGYNYVHINDFALERGIWEENALKIGDARLKVLVFSNIEALKISIVKKIADWALKGLKVVFLNTLPSRQPGYLDYTENDLQIQSQIKNMVNNNHAIFSPNGNAGTIIRDRLAIRSAIIFEKAEPTLQYIHKIIPEGNLFFIRHSKPYNYDVKLRFALQSKPPVIFDLFQGKNYAIPSAKIEQNSWSIEFCFPPYASIMILFPNMNQNIECDVALPYGIQQLVSPYSLMPIKEIPLNTWDLIVKDRNVAGDTKDFHLKLHELKDWREIKTIRYCIGPGQYSTSFELDSAECDGKCRVILDLGLVHDTAEVMVNNLNVQALLVPPYQCEITEFIKPGLNAIQVNTIGCLRNRLVGYGQNDPHYKGHSKKGLMPCGLIGPVVLRIHAP
jgi:hypothetical protein